MILNDQHHSSVAKEYGIRKLCQLKFTNNTGIEDYNPLTRTLPDDTTLGALYDGQSNYSVYCIVDGTTQLKVYQNTHIETNKLPAVQQEDYDDHVVRIWSNTKLFTNWATAIAVDRNLLSVSDPVSKYIESIATSSLHNGIPNGNLITIEHLLQHTSGLPTYWENGFTSDESTVYATLESYIENIISSTSALKFVPGTGYNYGSSTTFLGRVLEVAFGKTLDQIFNDEIFNPLNMKNSGFQINPEAVSSLAVYNGPEYEYPPDQTLFLGGEGMFSSMNDLAKFAGMLANHGALPDDTRLLSEAVYNQWIAPASNGLGFGCMGRFGESYGVVHGWSGAYNTHMYVHPDTKTGYVYITQSSPMTAGNETFGLIEALANGAQ